MESTRRRTLSIFQLSSTASGIRPTDYGRSRVGVMKPEGVFLPENANTPNHNVDVAGTEHENVYVRRVERKSYELTDHLGNVRVVLSDVKTTTEADGTGKPQGPYKATLLAANNYYPFGMLQPGRHWSTGEYRYGYNGKEMDHEVSGEGNQYDYGFRIYNPRIAKFLSVDPATVKFPKLSPYLYAENSPIMNIDVQGLWAWIANQAIIKGYLQLNAAFKDEVKSVVDYHRFNPLEMQNSINAMHRIWNDPSDRHYAPNVAKFLQETQISIVIVELNPGAKEVGGATTLGGRQIIINREILRNPIPKYDKESVMLHELVHGMGYGEFGAFSAQLAAGYLSADDILNYYTPKEKKTRHNDTYMSYEDRQYIMEGIPTELETELFGQNASINNYELKEGKTFADLIKAMYNYGKTITGQDNRLPSQENTDN